MTKIGFVALASLLFMGCTSAQGKAQLEMQISKDRNGYEVTVKNISSANVSVPDNMYLANPIATGYWLFMYQPRDRSIAYANVQGIGSPSMKSAKVPSHDLAPGHKEAERYEAEYLHGLFDSFPSQGCVYLLVKYKKTAAGKLIESPSSAPILVCPN